MLSRLSQWPQRQNQSLPCASWCSLHYSEHPSLLWIKLSVPIGVATVRHSRAEWARAPVGARRCPRIVLEHGQPELIAAVERGEIAVSETAEQALGFKRSLRSERFYQRSLSGSSPVIPWNNRRSRKRASAKCSITRPIQACLNSLNLPLRPSL